MPIYLKWTKSECYIRVLEDPAAKVNIGILEKNGWLNIKEPLWDLLVKAGARYPAVSDFTLSKGATHGVGGSGYHSFYDFGDPQSAIEYLEAKLDAIKLP